jgi:hypothetical protein
MQRIWTRRARKTFVFLALTAPLVWPTGCAAPRFDVCSLAGHQAIIDETNLHLTAGDCEAAVSQIEGVYASGCTDNQVRMIRASAHACTAGINFFQLVGNLATADLTGTGFWRTATQYFPSTTADTKTESTWYATDALLASLKPGKIVTSANQVNPDTVNVGSVKVSDRTDDANAYLLLVSMATIGTLQNRYSEPDATYYPTKVLGYDPATPSTELGWAKATNVGEEGCSYAAATLNVLDAIDQVGDQFSTSLAASLALFVTTYRSAIDTACEAGCYGTTGSGCTMAAGSCNGCPLSLRDRSACTGAVNEKNTCAAAGIAAFVNTTWVP